MNLVASWWRLPHLGKLLESPSSAPLGLEFPLGKTLPKLQLDLPRNVTSAILSKDSGNGAILPPAQVNRDRHRKVHRRRLPHHL